MTVRQRALGGTLTTGVVRRASVMLAERGLWWIIGGTEGRREVLETDRGLEA